MILRNTTALDTPRLAAMFARHVDGWGHDRLRVFVRYGRGAPFSGVCFYREARILVNIGRAVRYPLPIETAIARARSNRRCWWRERYFIEVADGYQLALFVFLHEFYHWLVARARRNPRQKEARCDRFAVRALVDDYGCVVRDAGGAKPPRASWDFQDLAAFVRAMPPRRIA
jgi:hypothetical protein